MVAAGKEGSAWAMAFVAEAIAMFAPSTNSSGFEMTLPIPAATV
jgi:hypothetical protein